MDLKEAIAVQNICSCLRYKIFKGKTIVDVFIAPYPRNVPLMKEMIDNFISDNEHLNDTIIKRYIFFDVFVLFKETSIGNDGYPFTVSPVWEVLPNIIDTLLV
jgi:hypothetical protein